MCLAIKRQLESLSVTDSSEIFESCRLAAIIFVDYVFLNDRSNSTVLTEGVKSTFQALDVNQARQQSPELLLWIFFMGHVAALGTEFCHWFLDSFSLALLLQGLHNYETVKRVLVEFLWVDVVCDEHLEAIWAEVSSYYSRALDYNLVHSQPLL
jgi:hypothetical protein